MSARVIASVSGVPETCGAKSAAREQVCPGSSEVLVEQAFVASSEKFAVAVETPLKVRGLMLVGS